MGQGFYSLALSPPWTPSPAQPPVYLYSLAVYCYRISPCMTIFTGSLERILALCQLYLESRFRKTASWCFASDQRLSL